MIAIAQQHGLATPEALGNNWIGWALVQQGRVGEGLSRIQISLTEFLATVPTMDLMWERFHLAHAHLKTGRPEEGLMEVAKLQAFSEVRGQRALDAELSEQKGEFLLTMGEPKITEAQQCFRTAIETARRQSAKTVELTATIQRAGPVGRAPETRVDRYLDPWS